MSDPGREFDLADILGVTTGILLAKMDGLYALLAFMVGEPVYTHQIPRAFWACAPALIEQHPWLASIEPPEGVPVETLLEWLAGMEMTHGKRHTVTPDARRWQRKDPVAELDQMMGNRPVVVVDALWRDNVQFQGGGGGGV